MVNQSESTLPRTRKKVGSCQSGKNSFNASESKQSKIGDELGKREIMVRSFMGGVVIPKAYS